MSTLIDIKELQFLEPPSILYETAQDFKEHISQATQSVKIFSGETHWMLYSHPLVLGAFREAHNRGVETHFISGPVLSVCKRGREKYLGILDLAKEGILKLYRRKERGHEKHFTIIDDKIAFIEDYHPSLLPLSDRHKTIVRVSSKEFKRVSKLFSEYLNQLKPSRNPRKDFILLTPYQIHYIMKSVTNFDELTKKGLQRRLQQLKEEGEKAKQIAKTILNN